MILFDLASPIVALIGAPVLAALAGGFAATFSKLMVSGITSLEPVIGMFVFSILFFGIMTDAGLLAPVITRIQRIVGGRPKRIVLASAALALLVHLDGSGAVCFIVVIPTLLPLYEALGMDRRVLACVTSMAAGVNFLPWTGPTLRASGALHLRVLDIFGPLLPVQMVGLAYVFVMAWWLGSREARRLSGTPRNVEVELPAPTVTGSSLRFYTNAAVTLLVMGAMICGLVEPVVAFVIGTAVALILNFPSSRAQRERVESHARAAILMATTLIAAGVFTGILSGTGMLKSLALSTASALPAGFGAHIPLILGFTAMPLSLLLDPDSYYFGVMPVLASVARSAGGSSLAVAQASLLGMMTTGFPVSPLTPATFLVTGLAKIELASHQRFTGPLLFGASMVMTFAALAMGVIPW